MYIVLLLSIDTHTDNHPPPTTHWPLYDLILGYNWSPIKPKYRLAMTSALGNETLRIIKVSAF